LLTSGVTITYAHNSLLDGNFTESSIGLTLTIILGLVFTRFQMFEYGHALFSIEDTVYGSVFYLITGFHGFHVFLGTIFLIVCLLRHMNYHFTNRHHFGFEAAA
jgi:heme/copper-type cytochrome/quinol oxidase subunit 3